MEADGCRTPSLLTLVEAWGFELAPATAYDYDEGRPVGPRDERRRRARERLLNALLLGRTAVSDQSPAPDHASVCH